MHINYLPNIAYFQYLLSDEKSLVLHLKDNYSRQTYRNRTEIAGPNGKLVLSIPTQKLDKNNREYKNIKISYSENWQKQHWKSMESAYRRSPYFEFYEDKFKRYYFNQDIEFLWEYNFELISLIISILRLNLELKIDKENKIEQENNYPLLKTVSYQQVFSNKYSFIENLSVIDLIFNKGPQSLQKIV